ncbi:MAG: hypothetical protein JZU65_16655 [Chlorobium sp.]|nr:hypothetical protein [Chlorobium sp.]
MIADKITGPYRKLKEINPSLADSQVIACKMHGSSCKPDSSYHFAGPTVVWNAAEKLWFMYFHYEENEWNLDKGHQKTTLATTSDLSSNVWEIWTDQDGNPRQVLPTTPRDVLWMNSQSSYHAIQQLPNGTWLAFMRGTGGVFENGAFKQDVTKLGFASSIDGRTWTYFTDNPIITQDQSTRKGVYRPGFIGFLGNGSYLACWSESNYYDLSPELMCGTTNDFHTVTRWQTGYLWNTEDGTMTPWREGNKFYLINGKTLLEFDLVPLK